MEQGNGKAGGMIVPCALKEGGRNLASIKVGEAHARLGQQEVPEEDGNLIPKLNSRLARPYKTQSEGETLR